MTATFLEIETMQAPSGQSLKQAHDTALKALSAATTRTGELRCHIAEIGAEIDEATAQRDAVFEKGRVAPARRGQDRPDATALTLTINTKTEELRAAQARLATLEGQLAALEEAEQRAAQMRRIAEAAQACAEARANAVRVFDAAPEKIRAILDELETAAGQQWAARAQFKSLVREASGDQSTHYSRDTAGAAATQAIIAELEGAGIDTGAALEVHGDPAHDFLAVAGGAAPSSAWREILRGGFAGIEASKNEDEFRRRVFQSAG